MRLVRVVALPLLLASAVAGCQQGVGDRCQLDSDCQTGLLCVIPAGGSVAEGGTCQMPGTGLDGGEDAAVEVPDMAVPPDLTGADMSALPDLVTPPDLVTVPDLVMLPDGGADA